MTVSRECSELVGRFVRREDDAWCEGFITAWNVQACGKAAEIERIEQLEATLEETIRALADMMRRER